MMRWRNVDNRKAKHAVALFASLSVMYHIDVAFLFIQNKKQITRKARYVP